MIADANSMTEEDPKQSRRERRYWVSALLVMISAYFLYRGLQHTSSVGQDQVYVLGNFLCGIFVSLSVAGVAFVKRRQGISINSLTAALLAFVVAIGPMAVSSLRIRVTAAHLTTIYNGLSEKGSPFPPTIDDPANHSPLLISHGYWVSDDRNRFEVYYHVGSDSYTMASPKSQWEWRDNRYDGPDSP